MKLLLKKGYKSGERWTHKTGILDKDLAFNVPYMRRFQELGIKAMEVAEETALEQEACMRRIREAIAELPPGGRYQ